MELQQIKNTTQSFELSSDQKRALARFVEFVNNNDCKCFILKGYAGTGKTTTVKEMVEFLKSHNHIYKLLASTGRAAKILRDTTNIQTETVHGCIYVYSDFNQDIKKVAEEQKENKNNSQKPLLLDFSLVKDTEDKEVFYIIDEASMISDKKDRNSQQATFGSGRLLNDLFKHNSKGKFIFIGDPCQLPPVGQDFSPALSADYLKEEYGYTTIEVSLTDIKRQENGNYIVFAAHKMRKLYDNPQPWKWAKFPFKGCRNIHILNSQAELVSRYVEIVKKNGFNDATMICNSNRQSNIVTQFIRPALGINSTTLQAGDLLLITQNNYISGLMNGDIVMVEGIGNQEIVAGLTFVDVSIKSMTSQKKFSQKLIANILYANETNISQSQQRNLFIDFYYRMKDLGIKKTNNTNSDFNRQMMKDPYLNALRAVYGYSITCHKVQGGEWNNIFLDIPRNFALGEKPYVYQWIYTAMTRAKKELYVVDDFFIM